nr:beta-1,3-glucanase family protein [Kibdelosporangium sp. MJ126-NF4]CEL19505.1 Glucan endo-1,3-beta-glucosidase precursor ((1->3)-beta-glucan endohydrolase) ((1->3)-beta-glucanase) [Kibdelosporangium sp. MJ126-NF4]CTQ94696.1 Glucan endo-1,3-beta-glucosidase precursor (EC 3.2.1.39) ((1->3)-beta-glucan endohydrolase) ((1->3)-beta-glucanase) [Kibdelosporangium sp. MJ126-NF4]
MRTRSKLTAIGAAFAAVAATTVLGGATSAAAAGPDSLPLSITNDTGRTDAVYLYVFGNVGGKPGYLNASGAFTPWNGGGAPPTPTPDASIAGPANGKSTTVQVPRGMESGRVYFSFGERLKFFLAPGGALVQPAPWADGDPNRDILFDWSEFTYNDGGLFLNSTQVDMFAIPNTLSVTNDSGEKISTRSPSAGFRNKVVDGIKAQSGWGGSVQTRKDGTVLRVLAPGKAAETGRLSGNYLDPYINSAWNAYTGKALTVIPFGDQPNAKFFGKTSGDVMNFTDGGGKQVASFKKPSSANVWGCDGALAAPNDKVVGPIARTLCAALNRGTLGTIDTQPGGKPGDFYKNKPTNEYAKLIHENIPDGKAYAFPFDDVSNGESLVHGAKPKSAGITLNSLTGGGGGDSNPPPPADPPADPPANPPADPPASGSGSKLVSDWQGKCIDVPSAEFSDGIRLQVHHCNGTPAQDWVFKDGTLKTMNNLCMDVAWGLPFNGTGIQIATCSGNPAQQFVLSEAGDLVNPQANKCVDIKDWNSADWGAQLQLWDCAGTANQKWKRA